MWSVAFVQSPAFQAETRGAIKLAEVLTNSTLENFPLTIQCVVAWRKKINFVPAGTPTNLAYVKLPDYVTDQRTVGNPKEKINKTALLGTALQQLGGSIPGVNKQTGSLIEGLGACSPADSLLRPMLHLTPTPTNRRRINRL